MSGDKTPMPEVWIGQPVKLVVLDEASKEYAEGDLQEVNDRGIVLEVEIHVGHPSQPVLYPWGAAIQLSEARTP